MQQREVDIKMNPIKVATIPKYPMMLKFQKKNDFRRLYPAEKMIAGNKKVKKNQLENYSY